MKSYFFAIVSFLFYIWCNGQTVYSGRVYDAGTLHPIHGAEITLSSTNQTTHTNFSADFLIKYGESEQSAYQFFHNSVFWSESQGTEIMITSLDGKVMLQDQVVGTYYLLPTLNKGMYVLSLTQANHAQSFKIMSDENETIKVDKRGIFHLDQSSGERSDTLTVSKEGYYEHEIVVSSKSQKLNIALLKGDYQNLKYLQELVSPLAFDVVSSKPSRSNLGDVQEAKIVYDRNTRSIYYMNSKRYELHYTFSAEVLGYNKGHGQFNLTQYRNNPDRYLFLAGLFYYKAIDTYVLQFVTAVEMTCTEVEELYQKILETSFLTRENLKFYPNKVEWEKCNQLPLVSSEELYAGQTYQGLNLAENYGYLRKIRSEQILTTYLSRRDMVVTDGIPNDLPVVAGIITSDLQTPLSHINVLSHSRNTPNMALRGAWEDETINKLEGQLVYLKVKGDGYELRPASLSEANEFWIDKEPQDTVILEKNTTFKELIELQNADHTFVNRIGGKAANFSELLHITERNIPTPEDAFAVPFYYYDQHIKRYGIDLWIASVMRESEFQTNAAYRQSMLELIRDSIVDSPIDPALTVLVKTKINDFRDFGAIRFRSSTNAEDLEDFSGAGLYDSYSAKQGHYTKTIDNAIRKVWASLWNWRAFEERSYFKIDHLSCAMGILAHRSFPDEDANGVLITKNLYNSNPGFTINVQFKEHSIVFPETGVLHDQMILFTWSVNPAEEFMIEYLSHSNIAALNGQRVLSDTEIYELGRYAKAIKRHFYYQIPHHCDCTYNDFGVDIEFKVDSEVSPRKIYVKQARLYK